MTPASLAAQAAAAFSRSDPADKARAVRRLAAARADGAVTAIGTADPPARPGRPDRPVLKPPRDMPRRRGGLAGRRALLHAVAHIELNAVDLALDIIARFSDPGRAGLALPARFFDDWLGVADDESRHFLMVSERLAALDAAYGDLPAHDGLWQAAEATAGDLLARLAVVPLVFEARGLDVTPGMIRRFEAEGDEASAAVLRVIYTDEIGHVATGHHWFLAVAEARGVDPVTTWQALVRAHVPGAVKPPFNADARQRAGLGPDYYLPVAASPPS